MYIAELHIFRIKPIKIYKDINRKYSDIPKTNDKYPLKVNY